MKVSKEDRFESWIRKQIDHYSPHLGLVLPRVKIKHDESESYLAITCTYPYLDPELRYNEKARSDWQKGEMKNDRILHELCHMLTDPLFCKATERYVTKYEVNDEREKLTDTLAAILRKFI